MKKLRKSLAVLLSVLMLCTVLPLSGLVSAADANLLVNGDFENGASNWTLHNDSDTVTEVIDDPTGSGRGKVMHTNSTYDTTAGRDDMFYQQVSLAANTDYVLTLKAYCYSTASNAAFIVNFYDTITGGKVTYNTTDVTGLECQNVESSSAVRVRLNVKSNTGKWVDVSIPFNSGSATSPRILISNYRVLQGQYYFDDIKLTKVGGEGGEEPEEPGDSELTDAPEGYNMLANGDFELGDANWSKLVSTIGVVADPTASGQGNVMQTDEAGGSTHMFQQGVAMTANTDYILTYKVYTYAAASTSPGWWVTLGDTSVTYSTSAVTSNGIEVKTVDSSSSTRVRFTITNAALYNKWIEVKIPFNSGNNTAPDIMFSNYRADAGQYYFDDIVLVRADGKMEPETDDGGDNGDGTNETDVPGNLLENGNFATGNLTGWENLYGVCTTSIVAGYNSTYGLQITAPSAWNMVRQKVNVDRDTDYVLTVWAKEANSMTLLVKDGGDTANVAQATLSGSEWKQYTVKFNSGDYNSVYIALMAGSTGGSVTVDSAALVKGSNNVLQNGDFETGNTTGWENLYGACTLSMTTGHTGSYALNFQGGQWNQTRQKVSVQANTNYVLTAWAKDATSVSFLVKDGGDTTNIAQITATAGSEWKQYTTTFNTGDNTSIYVAVMAGNNGGSAIVDDISLEKVEATVDNLVTNGNFEVGSLTGWTKYQSTAISASAARNGSYGVSVKGPGDWGGTLDQAITVKEGRTYQISFWYKTVSNGMNFAVRNSSKVNLLSSYFKETIWTKYEATFVADDTTVNLHFNGSGKGTTDELYVDDVVVIDLSNSENRAEILTDGGTSVRDYDEKPALAFRFLLDVNGLAYHNGNEYTANTGSVKLFKYADTMGNLVKFGAVMTNREAIGTDADAFVLESVNGSNILDVPARYLLSADDTSTSYAVRIINIPEENVSTEIYARPYYVYELNGEQVTVYGDIVSNNYSDVDSLRRAKRVLTIGGNYQDTDDYLYDVLKSAEYDQVILGNLEGNTYYKNDDNGVWTTTTGIDAATAIADERWQVIVVNDAELLDWVNANKLATAQVLYNIGWEDFEGDVAAAQAADVDGAMPAGTALENLATIDVAGLYDGDQLSDKGEYAVSLAWFVTLTGESLDLVDYIPEGIEDTDHYNMARAAAHAWYTPYEVSDLSEVVLVSGSDFQPDTWEKGLTTLQGLTGSLRNNGYGMFDGMLFVGDYTQTLGSDFDSSNEGLNILNKETTSLANFNKVFSQGNHDAAGIDKLNPYGNNDPAGAPYGVFVINEDNYTAYGGGGQQVANDLTAYCNEKLANGWGNKPIFVMSHLPLHYNYRTMKDGGANTASYIINALNSASDAGLNIIFLIAHNHSGGYDDYLGGAAIYIPKGDSILVPDPANINNAPIETELKFTYMNAGYTAYYNNMGMGADTALTMSTFRIQANGDVIITRYDASGVHNLKSAGQLSPYDRDYTQYTVADDRVYESSRIVGASKDEEYTGE